MNLGLGKKYGTPTKQLSAADQLLLLKFNSFLDAVRERNKTFHIPVTKEDKEMVAIRPLSPKTQMDTVSAIRRFHGFHLEISSCLMKGSANSATISTMIGSTKLGETSSSSNVF